MKVFVKSCVPRTACALAIVLAICAPGAWPSVLAQNAGQTEGAAKVARLYETELIVRTVKNLRDHAEVISFLDMAARHGVALINLAVKQDEDDEVPSGAVFYASNLAPRAKGYHTFDALRDTIAEAHRRGIKVRAWVPQFHDQMAVRKNPVWQMHVYIDGHAVPFRGTKGGEYFVNPLNPDVQTYERSIVAEIVGNYDVDGIVLDWLRFDDYPMDAGPDTQARFKEAFGYDPGGIDFSTDNERRRQWNDWRSARIGDYVKSVRQAIDELKPGLPLGVYMLPPAFIEVGQDAARFSRSVSFLSPMAYFRDWGFPPGWVYRDVLPGTLLKANGTPVIPVFDTDWADADYREILPNVRRDFPSITRLSWFVYGEWTETILERIGMLRSW